MTWSAFAGQPLNRFSVRLRLLLVLFAALLGWALPANVVHADAYTYDGPQLACVEVEVPSATHDASPQVSGPSAGLSLRSASVRDASTTRIRRSVATNNDALISGILRDASASKGNFGLGSATEAIANAAGEAWVGPGYRVSSGGKAWVSADGLRQYRPPSNKPNLSKVQANFESRFDASGRWQTNGHLDINPGGPGAC